MKKMITETKGALFFTLTMLIFLCFAMTAIPSFAASTRDPDGWMVDHNYCAYYKGREKKVTVPESAEWIFYLSDTVEELHIPAKALHGYDNVKYPNSILLYESYCRALSEAKNLKKITVSSENKHFIIEDGILFSRDKKALLYYPPTKKDKHYSIPSETTVIDTIVNTYLKSITLHEDVVYINTISAKKVTGLSIPKNVSTLSRLNISGKIKIDKENKYFTMSGEVVFNKKKTKLVYYSPSKKSKIYTVPSTVKNISKGAFSDNKYLKTLKVNTGIGEVDSNSITTIKIDKMSKRQARKAEFVNADLPKLKKIVIGKNNKYFKLIDGVLYRKDGKALVLYPSWKKNKSYHIPESVTKELSYFRNAYLEVLSIPSNFKFKYFLRSGMSLNVYLPKLREINVDQNNPYYTSVNGILFDKNKTKLLYYPGGRKDSSYVVPEGVTAFHYATFQNVKKEMTVMLPPTIKNILSAYVDDELSPNFKDMYSKITFLVKKDSISHKTLKRYGFDFDFI